MDFAQELDQNFITSVQNGNLPHLANLFLPQDLNLNKNDLWELFNSQSLSRHLDLQARILKDKQQGFYTIGSCGHEANSAIARVFRYNDMAFLHYRSAAFMLERARQLPGINMIEDILLSLTASSDDPIAQGRHKVFGSKALFVPPQTSTIASHLPKAVGAAFGLTLAKELHLAEMSTADSVILVSFGDASINHSAAQGALNTCQWLAHGNYPLPIVFICEDNGFGISVPTPADWIQQTMKNRPYLEYITCNGLDTIAVYQSAKQAERIARQQKKPVFLHLKTIRLLGHAGSDIETEYRSKQDILQDYAKDPLLYTAKILIAYQAATAQAIIDSYEQTRRQVASTVEKIIKRPKLKNAAQVMQAIIPPKKQQTNKPVFDKLKRDQLLDDQKWQLTSKRNMAQMINLALTDILLQYDNAVIFGEDVSKKGGVYHVTADLQKRFGKRRVFDSLLDETSILGTAIGLAQQGLLPIPEIQYLAYLHNAEDQIRGEAASLSFFSSGQFTNPMIIRIAGLGYQKGFGGHFHNDNSIAVLRDIPGIIIVCPSHGADAVKLLKYSCHQASVEQRVIVFLEPIALYMMKDLHDEGDNLWLSYYPENDDIKFSELGIYGTSKDYVIITYGNGYYLSRQAEKILQQQYNISVKIIDLRWLAPLPIENILQSIRDIKHVLIVDECRQTGSLSEQLMTVLVEHCTPLPCIKRITAKDSFIPLGPAAQYILPSKEDIIQAILTWERGD